MSKSARFLENKKTDRLGRLFDGGLNLKYQLGAQNQAGMSIVTTTTNGRLQEAYLYIILSNKFNLAEFYPALRQGVNERQPSILPKIGAGN